MAKRNPSSTWIVVLSLLACACQERALDFESQDSASGGKLASSSYVSGGAAANSVGAIGGTRAITQPPASSGSSWQAASGGRTSLETSTPPSVPEAQAGSAGICARDSRLAAGELQAAQALACNAWSIEPVPTSACHYELPMQSASGYQIDTDRMTPLLALSDGTARVLRSNADTRCGAGYRISNDRAQLELNPETCALVESSGATMRLIFGCIADQLAPTCVLDRTLSEQEGERIAATACNAWTVEPEALDATHCIYELPLSSADGTYQVNLAQMSPVLRSNDGRTIVLGDNSRTGSECRSGFHFSGSSAIQLNATACDQVAAGQAILLVVFGCTPSELTDVIE